MNPKRIKAICLDCGDTLIDESTEVKTAGDISLRANLIPGADKLMHSLKRSGYPLALVADGPVPTFENNLRPYGLYDLFDAVSISGAVGVAKPHPDIFHHAMQQLGIEEGNYNCVVMVGNHLGRDVKGANDVGMISVWLDWSPRRHKIPRDHSEIPHYTIQLPLELLPILDQLETEISSDAFPDLDG
jgi:putative hydrolase of the HAD superfamily